MSFVSINEYMNSLDETSKICIGDFVTFMSLEFPQITPKISFSMPMWWAGTKMYEGYVAVSAAKKHYSIHFLEEDYITKLKEELPNCSFGKRCINVKYGDEHSINLVKENVIQYLNNIL